MTWLGLTLLLLGILIVSFSSFMVVTIAFLLKFIIKTAPKDVQERLAGRPNPPFWKTILGVILALICLAAIVGVLIYAGVDAVKEDMSFWQIFLRYLILFEGYKLFDIIFLDWLMLTKLNVYQHFFPEVAGCESMKQFGFNFKSQLVKIFVFAAAALVIAGALRIIFC